MSILMSAADPTGAKLEDHLRELVAEIEAKCQRIAGDTRPEAQTVLHNNHQIMDLLTTALRHQEHSIKVLEAVGPNQGPPASRASASAPEAQHGTPATPGPRVALSPTHERRHVDRQGVGGVD